MNLAIPFEFSQQICMLLCCLRSTSVSMVCANDAGTEAFDFTCLLHTYFRVPDVTKAAVSNLHGCMYSDKVTFPKFDDLLL